jgi:hypothetical protein
MTDAAAGSAPDAQDAFFASTRGAHAAPSQPLPGGQEDYPASDREGYEIGPKAAQGTAPATAARPAEPIELKYMRETRNAAVFIAVVVGIVAALSLIATIIVGVQLSKLNSDLNNVGGGSNSSNCLSQGGTDPNC